MLVKHHSSNITRVAAGGNQLWICFKDNKTKTAENSRNDQWHPSHPTDLGPNHIGINHLLRRDQNDLPEAYLPPIGILTFNLPLIGILTLKGHSAVSQQISPTKLKPPAAQLTPKQTYLNPAQKTPKQTSLNPAQKTPKQTYLNPAQMTPMQTYFNLTHVLNPTQAFKGHQKFLQLKPSIAQFTAAPNTT